MEKQDLTKRKKAKKEPEDTESLQQKAKKLRNPTVKKCFCCCCGKDTKAFSEFPKSNSKLYAENMSRASICLHCLNALYFIIQHDMGYSDYHDTINHICMLYDFYYNESVADMAVKEARDNYIMSKYVTKSGLNPHTGKTYSDTIKERIIKSEEIFKQNAEEKKIENSYVKIDPKDAAFWGDGFADYQYKFLNKRYKEWTTDHACDTKAQRSILQNLCFVELKIQDEMKKDGDTSKLTRQFNDLLNSGNLQPRQSKDESINEQITFGTLINKWENDRPIPEPLPEFKDVDNIIYYVSVWFLGHLCKMIGVRNKWSKLYEEELEKYTVNKPEYEDEEDDEKKFEDLFGNTNE